MPQRAQPAETPKRSHSFSIALDWLAADAERYGLSRAAAQSSRCAAM